MPGAATLEPVTNLPTDGTPTYHQSYYGGPAVSKEEVLASAAPPGQAGPGYSFYHQQEQTYPNQYPGAGQTPANHAIAGEPGVHGDNASVSTMGDHDNYSA